MINGPRFSGGQKEFFHRSPGCAGPGSGECWAYHSSERDDSMFFRHDSAVCLRAGVLLAIPWFVAFPGLEEGDWPLNRGPTG